jgi:hypothetical protein
MRETTKPTVRLREQSSRFMLFKQYLVNSLKSAVRETYRNDVIQVPYFEEDRLFRKLDRIE